ncbi:MAG TPA: DUF3048 domain-containing protein [Mycobacteriales bacterium]|nr:DUF3048 domain-containing protein [Mycobacteriales bacterium]
MRQRSRVAQRAAPAVGLLCGAVLAACGSGGSGGAAPVNPLDGVPSAAPAGTPAGVTPSATPLPAPLTGRPATSPEAAAVPIVAVAIDAGRAPLAGLEQADVVYVSFPSTGRQRGLALYQSQDAARVGPVGDTRPLDGKLLVALDAVLQHSGGPAGFVKQVGAAELPEWSSLVHTSSFTRDPATGQVYGSTAAARQAPGAGPARGGLLLFAPPAPPPVTGPGPVEVRIPGQPTSSLTYDLASGTWRATVGAFSLSATNVVLQEVTYEPLVVPQTGGRTEGSPALEGAGKATMLSGPVVDVGTWNRPGRTTNLKYVGGNGTPTRLQPGTTWVLLVPAGTGVTVPAPPS